MWYKEKTIRANAQNVGWNVRKPYVINNSDPKGTFSFIIPLKHIFAFCEDYDKVLYGIKHTLTLTRNDDEDATFRAGGVDAGKTTLSNISWFMPHVTPADKDKMKLIKLSREKKKYRLVIE